MQTSVIKKTLPLALLLVTGSAWAEWLKVGSSTEDTFYFDSSIIRVEGDKRKVWELVDYKQRDKYGAFSARMRNEYDCKLEKFKFCPQLCIRSRWLQGRLYQMSNTPQKTGRTCRQLPLH